MSTRVSVEEQQAVPGAEPGAARPAEDMSSLLTRRAAEQPDTVCLVIEGAPPVTYAALFQDATRVAAGLRAAGVERGSAVATLIDNCIEGVHIWYACSLLGALWVPLNTALHGSFLAHQLRTARVHTLVTDSTRVDDVTEIADAVDGTLANVLVVGGTELPQRLGGATVTPWAQMLAGVSGSPQLVAAELSLADPAVVLFTSGTTGPAKGAVLSHAYLMNMARLYAENMEIRAGDVFFTTMPLFHLAGTCVAVLSPMVVGARGVLDQRFSVSRYWARVRETGATQSLLLGAMIQMLWVREPDDDERDNTLRVVLAQPLPAEMQEAFERRFGVVALGAYGLTEGGTVVMTSPGHPAPAGYAGPPLPAYQIIVADEDDVPLPPGEVGEILVRPNEPHIIFDGYCGDSEATLHVLGNLWLHTGDLGATDEHGNLRFVDRKKDYLRRRGENISSMEVEQVILELDGITEVAVVGVPSELSEDEVKACVVATSAASITEGQVVEHCIESLPYFAVPRFVEFLDQLPKNPIGKVQKNVLRSAHRPGRSWDREAVGLTVTRHTRRERSAGRS